MEPDSETLLLATTADTEAPPPPRTNENVAELEEKVLNEPQSMGENVYALAIATLIRDYVWLFKGSSAPKSRIVRIVVSMACVVGCIAMQIFLLRAVYGLLCQSAVLQIRHIYSNYQLTMYGKEHVEINENGFYRGLGHEFLQIGNFHDLDIDAKQSICQIPLAHQEYLCAILVIWTLTCVADLRRTLDQARGLLLTTPTVTSLMDVLEDGSDGVATVVGLTLPMKVILGLFCLLPRVLSVSILNFLGCRWLMATNSLSDVLLNALALEFMLVLKDLLYSTVTSKRNRFITENTLVTTPAAGSLSLIGTVGSSIWVATAFIWVYVYVYYLQGVLPDYRWDIKEVCATWQGAVHM